MLKKLFAAFKVVSKQQKEEPVTKMLTDDPLTVELIERIAKSYDYHFEIVQKDGTVLRFVKKMDRAEAPETGVW